MSSFFTNTQSFDLNEVSLSEFWSGLSVWIYRPHIINRKIIGVNILETWEVDLQSEFDNTLSSVLNVINDFTEFIAMKNQLNQIFKGVKNISDVEAKKQTAGFLLQFRELLPRNSTLFSPLLEIIFMDKKDGIIAFIPSKDVYLSAIAPPFPYLLHFSSSNNKLNLLTAKPVSESYNVSIAWLKMKVVPKIIRWCMCKNSGATVSSLNHISVKDFAKNYSYLKEKYGKALVETWPEFTDPQKFVYEDIGIAAYLMTLWDNEKEALKLQTKQSFVDLGCGNGLLVYILTLEGYPGIGIDVAKRAIWDKYPSETKLMEKAIIPSDSNLFPEYDWLIGNHSDELTPWIPIIAARSSYKMRVFLLPCCCYTFNGKFERPNTSKSTYQSYLEFIEELCDVSGFHVYLDKLRIPSTKRICLVCTSRNYEPDAELEIESQRKEYINQHSLKNVKDIESPEMKAFKPRPKTEKVQNCSQLNPAFVLSVIKIIFEMLIKQEHFIELELKDSKIKWNRGGSMHLKNAVEILKPETLLELKKQCGGLQTLLRNHRHIFSEQKGFVTISIPTINHPVFNQKKKHKNSRLTKQTCASNYRTKPCFFHFHHPQGCPLEDNCKYLHTVDE